MIGATVMQPMRRVESEPLYAQLEKLNEQRPNEEAAEDEDQAAGERNTENDTTTEGGRCCEPWERSRDATRRALDDPSSSMCALWLNYVVIALILVSTTCAVMATVKEVQNDHQKLLDTLEEVFTAFFTVEIFMRMWVASSWQTYFCSFSNIVDILATMPWYIEEIVEKSGNHTLLGSFRTLRVARLIRMVRLAKVARHSETTSLVFESLAASGSGLSVLVLLVGAGTVLSGTAVYAVESEDEVDPDTSPDMPKFNSVPISMWWALTTITTVGYGDMVPKTLLGRLIGSLTMVGGTLMTTLAVAVVTTSFTEQYRHRSEVSKAKKALRKRKDLEGFSKDGSSPKTRVSAPQLLVTRFQELEEETAATLALLQGELSSLPSDTTSPRKMNATERSILLKPKERLSLLLLDNLREQVSVLFKAAKGVAEEAIVADQMPHRQQHAEDMALASPSVMLTTGAHSSVPETQVPPRN